MLKGQRIFLTGGAGFIGSALVRRLAETNHCMVFDLLRRNALAASGYDKHPNVTLVQGDVRDPAAMLEAMKGCGYVVHLASIAGVDTVMREPVATMEIALEGTMNALRAALREGRDVECVRLRRPRRRRRRGSGLGRGFAAARNADRGGEHDKQRNESRTAHGAFLSSRVCRVLRLRTIAAASTAAAERAARAGVSVGLATSAHPPSLFEGAATQRPDSSQTAGNTQSCTLVHAVGHTPPRHM